MIDAVKLIIAAAKRGMREVIFDHRGRLFQVPWIAVNEWMEWVILGVLAVDNGCPSKTLNFALKFPNHAFGISWCSVIRFTCF